MLHLLYPDLGEPHACSPLLFSTNNEMNNNLQACRMLSLWVFLIALGTSISENKLWVSQSVRVRNPEKGWTKQVDNNRSLWTNFQDAIVF